MPDPTPMKPAKSDRPQVQQPSRHRVTRSPSQPAAIPARPHDDILSLQQTVGNQAVNDLLETNRTPLADPTSGIPPIVQSVLNRRQGQPLAPDTRTDMESRFNHKFDQVRIHTGEKATHSAQALDAAAYTVGSDIVMNRKPLESNTPDDQRLLAHELAHVVQQSRGGTPPPLLPSAPHEHEADAVAEAIATGQPSVTVQQSTGVGIARSNGKPKGSTAKGKGKSPKPASIPAKYNVEEHKWTEGNVEKVRIRVWGTVGDAITRPGLEKKYPLPKDVGLPGYDRWHLAGPDAIGAEEGIGYAPKNFNIGDTARVENVIRKARTAIRQRGGDVYFDFTAEYQIQGNHDGVEVRVLEKVNWKVEARLAGTDKSIPLVDETKKLTVVPRQVKSSTSGTATKKGTTKGKTKPSSKKTPAPKGGAAPATKPAPKAPSTAPSPKATKPKATPKVTPPTPPKAAAPKTTPTDNISTKPRAPIPAQMEPPGGIRKAGIGKRLLRGAGPNIVSLALGLLFSRWQEKRVQKRIENEIKRQQSAIDHEIASRAIEINRMLEEFPSKQLYAVIKLTLLNHETVDPIDAQTIEGFYPEVKLSLEGFSYEALSTSESIDIKILSTFPTLSRVIEESYTYTVGILEDPGPLSAETRSTLAGDWKGNFSTESWSIPINMLLLTTPSGGLIGTYEYGKNTGHLSGFLTKNKIGFNWHDNSPEREGERIYSPHGRGIWILSGNKLDGSWGFMDSYSNGGKWIMEKSSPT